MILISLPHRPVMPCYALLRPRRRGLSHSDVTPFFRLLVTSGILKVVFAFRTLSSLEFMLFGPTMAMMIAMLITMLIAMMITFDGDDRRQTDQVSHADDTCDASMLN